MKANNIAAASESVNLRIKKGKTKIFKYNTENINTITFDGETMEDEESFTYMGNIIDEQGGSDAGVNVRIEKAWTISLQMKKIWNSNQLSASQHQTHNPQYEHEDSSTVRR
ncbi:unnamed protein product [Schistosoma curassoni]|uniref:Lipocln_cytosolic_FA-bd_dom domain-containing protein n=1 Tax=Schistosoma curassoni TaxID=6186 RepID=A0A183L678_9TREM|nr:unnamed protein product [Schistosoma curassoni]